MTILEAIKNADIKATQKTIKMFGKDLVDTSPTGFVNIQIAATSKKTKDMLKNIGGVSKDGGVSLSLFDIAPRSISNLKSVKVKEFYADYFVEAMLESGYVAIAISRLA